MFRRRRAELLARGQAAGYSKTVASTWVLAFDRLRDTEPGAVGLLRLLAFCAPEEIPLRLLLQPRPGPAERLGQEVAPVLAPLLQDRLAAGDAVGALRRYSLVSPAAGGSVSVHRLVQAVTADQMPAELARQWRQAAAAVIEAAVHRDGGEVDAWPEFAALLRHAQVALTDDSAGMERIADYIGYSGSYLAARELAQRVLEGRIGSAAWSTRIPWPPAKAWPAGPALSAIRRRRGISTRRCCPFARGSSARTTLTPWPSGTTSPAGPGTLVTQRGPATCSLCCSPSASGSWARRAWIPWPPATTWPTGPGTRVTRPPPATSTLHCCPSASGFSARTTHTP